MYKKHFHDKCDINLVSNDDAAYKTTTILHGIYLMYENFHKLSFNLVFNLKIWFRMHFIK